METAATKETEMTERREAVIIISAFSGDVRSARGVVSRAITAALGRNQQCSEPNFVAYDRATRLDGIDRDPQYTLEVTDEEMQMISRKIIEGSAAAGFDRPPCDIYHD